MHEASGSEREEFMAGGLRHISQLVEQAASSDGIEKWKGMRKGSDEQEDRFGSSSVDNVELVKGMSSKFGNSAEVYLDLFKLYLCHLS